MAGNKEIEIKFRVDNPRAMARRLRAEGFRPLTRSSHETNTLYDLPGQKLRRKGEILRLRKYGSEWLLTHKAKGTAGRYKTRVELQTKVSDGAKMDGILRALGFSPAFRYEKFRAEWGDAKGHVVIDETPIGNFGEIEGPSRWIDAIARKLEIRPQDYITQSYTELFFAWKQESRSGASEMTFQALRTGRHRNKRR